METEDSEKQQIALNFYYALKDDEKLRRLAITFKSFTEDVKQKYIEVTGYRKITDRSVIDCWLTYCDKNSPEAINAVLYIDDPESIIYAYNNLLAKEIEFFFNPKGSLLVLYEFYLLKQFNVVWKRDQDSKILMTKVIANFVKNRNYSSLKEINIVVKQILLEEKTGIVFFNCFEKDAWEIEELFRNFDADMVDAVLLSKLENLLTDTKAEKWRVDNILLFLTNKIRKDESKKYTIFEYIKRYKETFERWDKNLNEMKQEIEHKPLLSKAKVNSATLDKFSAQNLRALLSLNQFKLLFGHHHPHQIYH